MIIYSPVNGEPINANSYILQPKNCFLMTRLGEPVPDSIIEIRDAITNICRCFNYSVIDANAKVTGKDYLLKIWKLIAATPLSIGIIHSEMPIRTRENIYYEIGAAQALGKETLLVKSPNLKIPSDMIRSEYIVYNHDFEQNFRKFMKTLFESASYYETVGDQLENNPLLAIDYYKRAFLLNEDNGLKSKIRKLLTSPGFNERAKNSIELSISAFAMD